MGQFQDKLCKGPKSQAVGTGDILALNFTATGGVDAQHTYLQLQVAKGAWTETSGASL